MDEIEFYSLVQFTDHLAETFLPEMIINRPGRTPPAQPLKCGRQLEKNRMKIRQRIFLDPRLG